MTLAEALNILRDAEMYAQHNLATPRFYDLPDGKVGVRFSPARPDGRMFGYNSFESMAELTRFIAGREAAQHEAKQDAFDAEEAAKAEAAKAAADALPLVNVTQE